MIFAVQYEFAGSYFIYNHKALILDLTVPIHTYAYTITFYSAGCYIIIYVDHV